MTFALLYTFSFAVGFHLGNTTPFNIGYVILAFVIFIAIELSFDFIEDHKFSKKND